MEEEEEVAETNNCPDPIDRKYDVLLLPFKSRTGSHSSKK